eukprot:scaffold6421_cov251-Ochromonas_danica.AAC.16
MSILITGANGQLGRFVLKHLVKQAAGKGVKIIAAMRSPSRAADLAELGVEIRKADYSDPSSLDEAFQGVSKVLLISSSEMSGQRVSQHRNVIEAAQRSGVKLLVYTSLLHASTTSLVFAGDHVATEEILKASTVPYIILRNGWYTENYLQSVPAALQHGALIGAAGEGKVSSAGREDYGEAAATVLLDSERYINQVIELAGDEAYTLSELTAELSAQTGRTIPYVNMSEKDFSQTLAAAGIPQVFADLLAGSDVAVSKGDLFDYNKVLSRLIGHGTTPLSVLLKASLQG